MSPLRLLPLGVGGAFSALPAVRRAGGGRRGMAPRFEAADGAPPPRRLDDPFEWIPLDIGHPVAVGAFQVEARPTIHHVPTTAFRLRGGGRTLGDSADTADAPALIARLAEADLVVHETNHGVHTPSERPAARRAKARLIHSPDEQAQAGSVLELLREGGLAEVQRRKVPARRRFAMLATPQETAMPRRPFQALFVLTLAMALPAGAVPLMVSHQGRLLDGSDQPVTATKHITFRVLPPQVQGQTDHPRWEETYEVSVNSGFYSVLIGDGTKGKALDSAVFATTEALYLGIAIDGTDVLPRMQFASAPYALSAGDTAQLGGKPPAFYATADGLASTQATLATAQTALAATQTSLADLGTELHASYSTTTAANALYLDATGDDATTGALGIGGALAVTGTTTLGTLTAGATTLGAATVAALDVKGASTLHGPTSANGDLAVGGALAVTGATTLGAATVAALDVKGASTLHGPTSASGDLAVGGGATVAGTVSASRYTGPTGVVVGGAFSVDTGAVDGGRFIWASQGANDWRAGNLGGKLRFFPGENTFEALSMTADGTYLFRGPGGTDALRITRETTTLPAAATNNLVMASSNSAQVWNSQPAVGDTSVAIDGTLIRRVQRVVGSNGDDRDDGFVAGRVLTFVKRRADTQIRFTYSDNLRVVSSLGTQSPACSWTVYLNKGATLDAVNARPCKDPSPIAAFVHDPGGSNHHQQASLVGYCKAMYGAAAASPAVNLDAGVYTVAIKVNSHPAHPTLSAADCWTGWNAPNWGGSTADMGMNAGFTQYVIEAEEVF